MQVRRVTLNAGRERPAPFLPSGNIPAEHQFLSCLFLAFPCPDSLILHSAAEAHVWWSLSNWQDWRKSVSDLNEKVLWDLCSEEALWKLKVFSSCSSFIRIIDLLARDIELGFWNWFCFSLRAIGKMRVYTLSMGWFVKQGFYSSWHRARSNPWPDPLQRFHCR